MICKNISLEYCVVFFILISVLFINSRPVYGQNLTQLGFGFAVQSTSTGSKIYVFGNQDVACLNGGNGQLIWMKVIPGGSDDVGPVIAGSTLVYMGGGGFFTAYGVALNDGHTIWTLEKRSPVLASHGDEVFLATQGGLGVIAVNALNGDIVWEKRAVTVGLTLKYLAVADDHIFTDSPYVWDSVTSKIIQKLSIDPGKVISYGDKIYMTGSSMPVYALDAKHGNILWKKLNPIKFSAEDTSEVDIAVSAKYVVVMFYENSSAQTHKALLRVYSAKNGKVLWEKRVTSGPSLASDLISTDNKHVYLIQDKWEIISGNKHRQSTIYAYDARNGRKIWGYRTDGDVLGPTASNGNTVFASGDTNKPPDFTVLYAINSSTGTLKWKYSFYSY